MQGSRFLATNAVVNRICAMRDPLCAMRTALSRCRAVRRAPRTGVREHPFRRGDSFGLACGQPNSGPRLQGRSLPPDPSQRTAFAVNAPAEPRACESRDGSTLVDRASPWGTRSSRVDRSRFSAGRYSVCASVGRCVRAWASAAGGVRSLAGRRPSQTSLSDPQRMPTTERRATQRERTPRDEP